MNPFNTFGPDVFTYLKQICVQIKENIIGKTASGLVTFWQNTGPKKPVYEPSHFKHLAMFCGCTVWFVSDLVGNPEDRFSHNKAQ